MTDRKTKLRLVPPDETAVHVAGVDLDRMARNLADDIEAAGRLDGVGFIYVARSSTSRENMIRICLHMSKQDEAAVAKEIASDLPLIVTASTDGLRFMMETIVRLRHPEFKVPEPRAGYVMAWLLYDDKSHVEYLRAEEVLLD